MGIAHSSRYTNLDGKPVVAPVVKIWSEGAEYVRFVDTIWTQILQPDCSSPEKPQPVFRRAKAIVVQGQSTGEIHYLSRDSLVAALGHDLHQVSHFVNRKKDYEIYVRWYQGFVTDPKTGRLRDSCYLDPIPDPATGQIMRKIDLHNTYDACFVSELKGGDDFKLDDVKVGVAKFSDDIPDGWIKHTPVLFP